MKIIQKIAKAKAEIKNSKLKKEGRNEFSKYDYFTPSQIEFLVNQVCTDNELLTTFDLIRNELGVFGKLTIYDQTSEEKLEFVMATAIPEIKATNIAQQLGGCVTYTERYLKMSAFGITDNKLDFDTTENTKQASNTISTETRKPTLDEMPVHKLKVPLAETLLDKAIARAKAGEPGIWDSLNENYAVTASQKGKFESAMNTKN